MRDPYYLAARRTLLDALEALREHRDAIVVVGAQAVYLRTGSANAGIAEYTTDADLAVMSDRLADAPLLPEAMATRFEPGSGNPAFPAEPGLWTRSIDIEGQTIHVPVDLIVPEGIAPPGGSRGARLGPHGRRAARKALGLEAAALDNDVMDVHALDVDDQRRIEARVAGPTALLIAKAHKIADRLDPRSRADRLRDKDASDVYRLMVTTAPELVNDVVPRLLQDPRIAGPTRRGLDLLMDQFGNRRGDGVEMAVRSLRIGVPEDRVRSVCVRFVASLDQTWRE
jgi:hypothetical protein